jgi:hypothetical protein
MGIIKHAVISLFIITSLPTLHLKAQQRLKVAVFAPIYLDSAFKGDDYKLGNSNLPKNMLPGLDFYNGVMMALDSLQAEGKDLEVLFYDSKGSESIYSIIRKPEFDGVSLIVADFNNRQDIKPLADFALQKNIPLISSTYPNDGGVTNNPYFVMINTSLKTHVEQIYKYLQRYYSTTHIIYVKRKGQLEDLVQYYFQEAGKATASVPLIYKTVEFNDTSKASTLINNLDSNLINTIVCGSLNESYGVKLVKMLAAAKQYDCTVMGMPTWDGLKELDESDCNGVNLIYSTPYNFVRSQPTAMTLSTNYKIQFNGRPSDMFFKGYESMYHFCSLLLKNPADIMGHLSDKNFKLFNDFNIEPVKNSKDESVQYLENKKLYFIKKINGVTK